MMARFPIPGGEGLAHVQISAATCIVMKTIILPDGKTAVGDDIDGIIPYVDHPLPATDQRHFRLVLFAALPKAQSNGAKGEVGEFS